MSREAIRRIRPVLAMLPVSLLAFGAAAQDDPVDFGERIWPIIMERCIQCHGPEEQKEDLRFDSKEAIMHGSKFGEVIVPGDTGESELIRRISLPADDDDVMPEKGDALEKSEIDLFVRWIKEGAEFGDWEPPENIIIGRPPTIYDELGKDLADPSAEALSELVELGALAMPISQESPLIRISFQLAGAKIDNSVLSGLDPLTKHVTWLNLAGTSVTDEGLAQVGVLTNLTRLHLEKTGIGDAGLEHLGGLKYLEYLNLYGTEVTDSGLAHLSTLENLKKLFLWQTKVSSDGAKQLSTALPDVDINLGIDEAPVVPETQSKSLIEVDFAQLFDDGSCCATAHAAGGTCEHECCIEASDKNEVCVKCNPGAPAKLLALQDKD